MELRIIFLLDQFLYAYCNSKNTDEFLYKPIFIHILQFKQKRRFKKKTIFISLLQFQENNIIFIDKPISIRLLQLKQNRPFFL